MCSVSSGKCASAEVAIDYDKRLSMYLAQTWNTICYVVLPATVLVKAEPRIRDTKGKGKGK